jgi:UPF0271 protein
MEHGEVEPIDGPPMTLDAESICVHGDGPTAVDIVERVVAVLGELDHPMRAATVNDSEDIPR